MNRSAQQHLAKAKDYVARGEEFYRKAAEEIARGAGSRSDALEPGSRSDEQLGKGDTWSA